MSKTYGISVTVSSTTYERFEALCKHWELSKSRCIEDIINRQYFEMIYKEGIDLKTLNTEDTK